MFVPIFDVFFLIVPSHSVLWFLLRRIFFLNKSFFFNLNEKIYLGLCD